MGLESLQQPRFAGSSRLHNKFIQAETASRFGLIQALDRTMANSQISQSIAPVVSMLVTVGVAVFVVAAISFFVARHFGGQSRPKRKAIFTVVSGLGFLGIMYFVYLRASGRA